MKDEKSAFIRFDLRHLRSIKRIRLDGKRPY